jgi:hypothetical protein
VVSGERVTEVFVVVSPEKLAALDEVRPLAV